MNGTYDVCVNSYIIISSSTITSKEDRIMLSLYHSMSRISLLLHEAEDLLYMKNLDPLLHSTTNRCD